MKRLLPCLLVSTGLFLASPLAAKDAPPRFQTIEVKHFTVAPGVPLSPAFVEFFYAGLVADLPKQKLAERVIEDGGTVPEAEAADSAIVEGVFTDYGKGGLGPGHVTIDLKIYRRSDRSVIVALTPRLPFKSSPFNKDENVAKASAVRAAYAIKRALK